jgi:RNA polymerase sigma-70 factor (ECF subfamily)
VIETRSGDGDDRRLVERLTTRRDPDAFASLYSRHTTMLYRFALRLTAGDETAAEDLVHDAWVVAVEKLPAFQWKSTLRTWLSAIVVNLARERLRRSDREAGLPDDYATNDGPLQGAFDRVDVARALATLAPGYRMVIVMHDVEGYTHEEIASMLEIDPGTSKSQLSRARAAMRRALSTRGSAHVR